MSTLLISTAKATNANSNLSVAEADYYFRATRLYATAWDAAAAVPTAEGWTTTDVEPLAETSIALTGGTGTLAVGDYVKFGSHASEYQVASAFSASPLVLSAPGLTQQVEVGDTLIRRTASAKEKALIWATSILDNAFDWYGAKRTTTQARRWPRSGVTNLDGEFYDYDTIPATIKNATAELALALLERNRMKDSSLLGLGISSGSVGPLQVSMDKTLLQNLIPDGVREMLRTFGDLSALMNRGGGGTISLQRA